MQTTFSACGCLACLRIDRYALDHSGKMDWELEVNHRVWLPIQPEVGRVHQPFIVVAAVAHHGTWPLGPGMDEV